MATAPKKDKRRYVEEDSTEWEAGGELSRTGEIGERASERERWPGGRSNVIDNGEKPNQSEDSSLMARSQVLEDLGKTLLAC